MQNKIYELSLLSLEDKDYFTHNIVKNMKVNYYWSNDWSELFYIRLAQLAFISTSYDTPDGLVLLPELQFEYGILDFKNLHISAKVKKLIKENNFELTFDENFDTILEKITTHHSKYNWLKGKYLTLMQQLHINHQKHKDFRLHSVELRSKTDGEIVAGEIGYTIGATYTSLTGFSSREKKYNNCGTLQLVYLAQHLQKRGFYFWNLGHPHMLYKKHLGSITYKREKFLQRWQEATENIPLKNLSIFFNNII